MISSISTFLFALGVYNLIGSLILSCFLSNSLGDLILRRQFKIFTNNYHLGTAGKMWLVWAISLNFFFALINILAKGWEGRSQLDLLILDLVLYLIFLILTIIGLRSSNYSKGLWFCFPLFLFWVFWGAYLLLDIMFI